jgi:metal-responsive CopG/Arc/MetJ family transcriptional regulator
MKTAISIPDDVFAEAERFAKKLGVSRSELFTRAVRRFVEQHQAQEVRASYDRAFASDACGDEDEFRAAAIRKTLGDVEW